MRIWLGVTLACLLGWQAVQWAATGSIGVPGLWTVEPGADGGEGLPDRASVRSWVRGSVEEAVGGVDAEGLPLYRFTVWLDAPAETRARVQSVSYRFPAPGAKPPSAVSLDKSTGFKVKFGGASCSGKINVTIAFEGGAERRLQVDGCDILS